MEMISLSVRFVETSPKISLTKDNPSVNDISLNLLNSAFITVL